MRLIFVYFEKRRLEKKIEFLLLFVYNETIVFFRGGLFSWGR